MKHERHLVTGATGFVGGALVLELLEKTDAEILCLARPSDDAATAGERLRSALALAMRAYGRDHLAAEASRRCRAVPGDLTQARCGVDVAGLGAVSEVWHSAASLEFEDENEEEIFRNNVGGTAAVLELARELESTTFNYISTAYVAGRQSGHIAEVLPSATAAVHNAYEKSKVHAELLVAEARDTRVRIVRPSIVIGHSQTYAATSFTGMYGFIRGMVKIKREVNKRLGDYLRYRPLRILADAEAQLNLIPVDVVARNAVALSLRDAGPGIYNLTNACPATVADGIDLLCEELELRRPRYVGNEREFTSLDRELHSRITFYAPYLFDDKAFDRSNLDAVLGADASNAPLSRERLRSYLRWYLDFLARRTAPAAA